MKRDCFHSAFPRIMSLLKGSISPRNVVISHGEEEKEGRKREGEREREKKYWVSVEDELLSTCQARKDSTSALCWNFCHYPGTWHHSQLAWGTPLDNEVLSEGSSDGLWTFFHHLHIFIKALAYRLRFQIILLPSLASLADAFDTSLHTKNNESTKCFSDHKEHLLTPP